jgi:hypothetical protein
VDIFKQAEEANADYLDTQAGLIFKIQDYNRAKKLGLPTAGIEVCDLEGNYVGIVLEKFKNNSN